MYRNRGEKTHKTEQSGAKDKQEKGQRPSPIDRQEFQRSEAIRQNNCRSIAEYTPIDRPKFTKNHSEIVDRSQYASQSIGRSIMIKIESPSIDRENQLIDRQNFLMQNGIVFQTFKTPNFEQK